MFLLRLQVKEVALKNPDNQKHPGRNLARRYGTTLYSQANLIFILLLARKTFLHHLGLVSLCFINNVTVPCS